MRLTPDDANVQFRREFEAWLDEHLPSKDVMEAEPRRSSSHLPEWGRTLQREMFEAGYLVPGWPPELGGRNATPEEQMAYFEVINDRMVPRSLNPQGLSICAASIVEFGTEEQRERFVLPTLKGELTWCVGMSEPNAGSDLASLSTKAERLDGHFVVNGQKVWTSGAHESDYCMCYVRTDPEAPKHRGISVLIIDMRTPGITVRPLPELTDPHHIDFNEVFFTDVEVPVENLLGELNNGWTVSQGALRHERGMLWIMNVGRMERTLKGLVRVARRADGRGGKLGDDPRLAEAIGRLATDTEAMRCLGYRGFAKATRGEMPPEHLVLKLFCSEAEQRANLLAAESLGLEGLDLDGPGPNRVMEWDLVNFGPDTVELAAMNAFYDGAWAVQYLRSFSVTIAGGTSEIQRNIIAERLLGLPRGEGTARMLAEIAAEAAQRFGPSPAFVSDDGLTLSYEQFDTLADEAAVGLAELGVGEGDVVGLLLPSVPEHFVAYVAAAKLGALTAAVNPKLVQAERAAVLRAANPRVLVATEELAPSDPDGQFTTVVVEPAARPAAVLDGVRHPGARPVPLERDADRPIAIVFTSGTTGLPKGAVFCGRQIGFITQCDVGEDWGGGGHSMAGSALAHLGPTTKLAGNLKRGGTQHLSQKPWRAADALRMVAELKIAALGGVPTQIALMLRDPSFETTDLSSVRAVVMGGGPATPALIREARARIGAPLAVRYSCTEAGIGCGTGFTDPDEDAEVSVGRPQPGVRLIVVDESGAPVEPGSIGEVCLGSPAVMEGYWRNSGANADVFTEDGSVRTGDLGWVDEHGRLRLAGRSRERYVRGGYNVYPMEVESVLAEHPDVAAVAVVSRDDPVMGEVGVAIVVPQPNAATPGLAQLRDFASQHLARYKLPEDVVVLSALPLTAAEKVDRRALERLVASS